MTQAIQALQTMALVHRFMLPYALIGRVPCNRDIEAEVHRLREDEQLDLEVQDFTTLCQQVRVEAAALLHAPGSA